MTELNNPWREKYRRSLAEQERLESTVEAQKTMLLRAVLNLSAAADGKDTVLDERLHAIISSIKGNDVAGFDRMLKSLPRVTEEADKRQQVHWKDIKGLLADVAVQVQKQTPSINLKSPINGFKKQLPKSYPPVIGAAIKKYLGELSHMQQQAIGHTPDSKAGLFGKLFGDKPVEEEEKPAAQDRQEESENTDDEPKNTVIPIVGDENWEEVDESVLGDEPVHSGEVIIKDPTDDNSGYKRERSIPESVLREEYGHKKTSPEVPSRVSIILVELLDHFKTVPEAKQKANKARKRIEQGLRWFELVPTLEDIRDFVLQAYLGADKEYQQYLEHLYQELSDILDALGISIKTEEQMRLAANTLQNNVNEGMNNITGALSDNNIDTLKQAVEGHVQQLQSALTQFSDMSPREERETLKKQLHSLADKVKQMEANEKAIRGKLEEERKRAITDTLTGLPNREAYNERIYQEVQRWQRYENPLTIAVIDIDFFKKINDNYGHQIGDKVLKIVAQTVSKLLREVDFMARFGGEEFVVLLPETDADNALSLLNRIRESLAKKPLKYKEDKISLTVSIGIAQFGGDDTSEVAFGRADEALYKAKENGRNQCVVL